MTNVYWAPGGGRVATIAPGPDDLFVVTTIGGRRALFQPIFEYDQALAVAQAFVKAQAPVPVTVKVLCVTAAEAKAMGFVPAVPEAPTSEEAAEAREVAVSTLWNVVRNGSDAKARNDAWRMLKELGEVK
jgi:hypothetical protein